MIEYTIFGPHHSIHRRMRTKMVPFNVSKYSYRGVSIFPHRVPSGIFIYFQSIDVFFLRYPMHWCSSSLWSSLVRQLLWCLLRTMNWWCPAPGPAQRAHYILVFGVLFYFLSCIFCWNYFHEFYTIYIPLLLIIEYSRSQRNCTYNRAN